MFNYLHTQHVNIKFKHHLISITRNPGRKYQDSTRNLPGLYQDSTRNSGNPTRTTRNPPGILAILPGLPGILAILPGLPGLHQDSTRNPGNPTRTTRNFPGIRGAVESSARRAGEGVALLSTSSPRFEVFDGRTTPSFLFSAAMARGGANLLSFLFFLMATLLPSLFSYVVV